MKHIYYILATALLLASCSKESPIPSGKPLPPQDMAEVTLGEIRLSDADATFIPEASSATRATTATLPAGATLRLYAFKKGVTDFNDKITTRTYTIDAAGAAVLDAGQERLYLPMGEVDIYLAGPLVRNVGEADNPIWQDVAGESGIYPYSGIDLIAAYTPATIQSGDVNPLPVMILRHKMSKVQVVVSRHESGAYENLVVKVIKLYGQSQSGSYTLDATGGVITPGALSDFLFAPITVETLYEKYSGTALLIPEPTKELKIETTFTCNQIGMDGDVHPTLTYLQSGIISTALAAGTATRFTASPLTPVEIKWRVKVLPWDAVDQGETVVPGIVQAPPVTNGLVGWYDGHNPPIIINDVLVWRDGSTQQNHGKILDGTIWEAASNSYLGQNEKAGIELINENASYLYSAQNGMTVEMIWKRQDAYGDPIVFQIGKVDPVRTTFQSWKPAGTKFCCWNEGAYYKSYNWGISTQEEDVDNFACWTWAKGGHQKSSGYYNRGYKNGIPQTTGTPTTVKPLVGQSYIAFGLNMTGWRIQAVRIYNRQLTDAEIKLNHDFDKQYYSLKY